jgi:hypothetical protein
MISIVCMSIALAFSWGAVTFACWLLDI